MNQNRQELCELAEIVHAKPLSGEFEELLFGSDSGNTLWVKFLDKDGINEWIGKFGDAGQGSRQVIKVIEPDVFFVSAGSFAYLLGATERKLKSQYSHKFSCDITYDISRKLLIIADYKKLQWIDFDGKVSFSHEISVDGISNLKIKDNILSGIAYKNYGDEEQRFWFDLNDLKILRWEKPWWSFW